MNHDLNVNSVFLLLYSKIMQLIESSGQPNVISVQFRPNISAEYLAKTISVFKTCFGISAKTLILAETVSFRPK